MIKNTSAACVDGLSPVKRIAAIHDLSCFGRCALTVVIPTLSAFGYQVVPVPTCLLSTHTGGFEDMYFEDGTHAMAKIAEHFDALGLKFDAIYTGFLGNAEQIDLVKAFIERFSDGNTLVLVDPVMGDGGKLYSTYTKQLCDRMHELCKYADVITPNLTEACILAGKDYVDTSLMSEQQLREFADGLCESLSHLGASEKVITGIHSGKDKLCVLCNRAQSEQSFVHTVERVHKEYPGTGDLFASVLLGYLLRGESFDVAARRASDFTSRVMRYSARFASPEREGVALEAFLGELALPSPTL